MLSFGHAVWMVRSALGIYVVGMGLPVVLTENTRLDVHHQMAYSW